MIPCILVLQLLGLDPVSVQEEIVANQDHKGLVNDFFVVLLLSLEWPNLSLVNYNKSIKHDDGLDLENWRFTHL